MLFWALKGTRGGFSRAYCDCLVEIVMAVSPSLYESGTGDFGHTTGLMLYVIEFGLPASVASFPRPIDGPAVLYFGMIHPIIDGLL